MEMSQRGAVSPCKQRRLAWATQSSFLDEILGSETLPRLPAKCRRYEDLLYRGGDEVVVAEEFGEGGFGEEWEGDGTGALGEIECGE